jgi:hypothetical protein
MASSGYIIYPFQVSDAAADAVERVHTLTQTTKNTLYTVENYI